jgi:hypothetical protein
MCITRLKKNFQAKGKVMKNLIAFVAATAMLFSLNSAIADDHDGGPFYAFYHLQVADPAALVSAMDTFWASDCGKQYPADVALLQEVFNGSSPSTHFIINTFQTSSDQEKATQLMRSCPDAVAFLQSLAASGTVPISQYMGTAPIDESNWTEDTVFSKIDIVVEPQNQPRYAAAYAKMMMKISRDVELRSYGLGRRSLWQRQIHALGLDGCEIHPRAECDNPALNRASGIHGVQSGCWTHA